MNVLFLCHRLPFPPKRGGKIRPFNIIKHFSEAGHKVTVGSLARSDEEAAEGRDLADYCEKVLVGQISRVGAVSQMVARLPTPAPSSMGYFYSRSLHKQVRSEAYNTQFDVVFVHCSSAAQYARHISGASMIIDFGDMDSQKWLDYSRFRRFPLSIGYRLEGIKLSAAEKRLARSFDLATCTTRAELETLENFNVARSTGWFPNGVDASYFTPLDDGYDPDLICFVGRMDYYPNQQGMLEFCEKVLPKLQSRRPGTRLLIVGAEPSRKIWNLASLPGVSVTGTVPDVRDHIRGAALTVAPLAIARGTQNKILESMALGVPVVSSKIAASGVDAESEEHLLTATSSDDYVSAILRLLTDPIERSRIAKAGRARILARHDWAHSMRTLDGLLSSKLGLSV